MTNPSPPLTLANTPIQLGHYQLLAAIGQGGMGLVYRARDTRLEREVAIKCLRRELFEAHYAERFKREALLLAKLNHPNIVQIYDFIETPDQLALVMELVDGENLHIHLREHLVSIPQRLKWLTQISEGLAVAHDAGIIHRDLKTENILINRRGQAKISDLGIAKSQDFNATLTDHVAGSYLAMSPEQAKGEAINFKSDLFSLGILAYQLLCGVHPFGDTHNKLQLMQRIISQPPTAPRQYNPELPTEAIELLGQLLSKDADNRPDNTHWVAAQFERLTGLVKESVALNDDTQALTLPLAKETATQEHPTFETRFTSANKPAAVFRQQKIKTFFANNKMLLSLAMVGLLAITGWQFFLNDKIKADHPIEAYSQSGEMKKGMEALKLYDRPGSLDKAEASFTRILQHKADNPGALAGMSLVYSYRYSGDNEDAIWIQKADASAQQALQLDPHLALTHIAMGRVLIHKGQHDQALQEFEKALTLEPGNIIAWYLKITVLRLTHRHEEAIQFAQQGLQQFPQERSIADELGYVYLDQGKYPEAEEAFRLSIQLQPDAIVAYAGLNMVLEFQNRSDEALEVLQQGLQIRPSAWLYSNLGTSLFMRGNYPDAVTAFEAAVSPDKGNPNSYLAWANLADTLRWIPGHEKDSLTAYSKARDLLQRRLSHNPDNAILVSRMGLYQARLGNSEDSTPLLLRSLELAPKNSAMYFRAGLAYELLGNRQAALDALTKAVELGYPVNFIQAEPDLLNLRRQSGSF